MTTSTLAGPAERLAAYTDTSGGPDACWPFTGCVTSAGYGRIRPGAGAPTTNAHRLAFELHHGRSPQPGLVLDHICHDPAVCAGGPCPHRSCLNPTHIVEATSARNGSRERSARTNRYTGPTRVPPRPTPAERQAARMSTPAPPAPPDTPTTTTTTGWLTTEETARRLRISDRAVRRWADAGHLTPWRTPGGDTRRGWRSFPADQVNALAALLDTARATPGPLRWDAPPLDTWKPSPP